MLLKVLSRPFQQGEGPSRGLLWAMRNFANVCWQLWYSRHGGNHSARPGVGDGVQLGGGGGHLLPPLHLPHLDLGRAQGPDQQTLRVPCPRYWCLKRLEKYFMNWKIFYEFIKIFYEFIKIFYEFINNNMIMSTLLTLLPPCCCAAITRVTPPGEEQRRRRI